MKIKFEKIHSNAKIPCYAHDGDSGMDLASCETISILPHSYAKIHTGIRCEIPDGYEIQIRPRSGLAARGVVAMFGTVDMGYRGEMSVSLYNFNDDVYHVSSGDRIAQIVISPVVRAEVVEGTIDTNSDRGENGFGSTGV